MKLLFGYILFLLLFISCNKQQTFEQKPKEFIEIDWKTNRGYLLRDEGISIIEKLNLKSIDRSMITLMHKQDTIGKYIKSPGTGHYVLCIWDPQIESDANAHFLIEIKNIKNEKFEVIAKERYIHNNTVGCWNNHYNGLDLHYDYFTFQACRGEKGFSAVDNYYFTYVIPQNELKAIPDKFAISSSDKVKVLASKKNYLPQSISYFYRYEEFDWKNEKHANEIKMDTFTITYELSGTLWLADTINHWKKFK